MTLVRVRRTRPRPDGALTGAAGLMYFRPTRSRLVTGTVITEVLPIAFPVTLDPDGSADVELAPTAADWVWEVTEKITGTPTALVYVAVPDGLPVDYSMLVRVDPASLEPAAVPAPAWFAYVDDLAATAAQAQAEAVAAATGFSIGTVTTTAPGSAAQATISGQAPDRKLNLDLPQGQTGPALTASVIGTVTGPETPGAPGMKGDKGDKGDPGGFTTATDLGTMDLNTVLTAGLYRVTQGANVTTALNYPMTLNATAVMHVMMVSATNVIQQFEFVLSTPSGRGFWQRTTSNGGATWGAWRFFASQRVDNTAGRAIYTWDDTAVPGREQLIWGDTGSREISAFLDATKWVAGNIKIRRVGSEVELRAYGLDNVAGVVGSVGILNAQLPAGFRNQHTVAGFAQVGANAGQVITAFSATNATIVGVVDGAICGFTAKWQTTDPWPTVLPGNADGSIPNL